ncbi:WD40-repeat-containing domain protein [Lentinula aciculospora]|uniref:WD40-repeat-containing domain protein n=1 Tax=Lentinula aciculospora TaxID=153920 RepID=A0A9W9AVX2_9AGAR|nr:WD40-repeat-containing domain protein [Lentinula aciculospora]
METSGNPVLLASPNLSTTSSPLRNNTISTIATGQAYILSLANLDGKYAAMSSGSSSSSSSKNTGINENSTCPIYLYSKYTLQREQTLPGHEISSTFMRSVNSIAGLGRPVLVSSGKDGSVRVWDERSGSPGIQMTDLSKSRAFLSFDVSLDGYTVAAGTELQGDDASVLYWDPRQPAAPLRTHSSTHSDDITVVHFSPKRPGVLLTASSDGLVSLSNSDEVDEDESVINVGNWGCSISQAGWLPDGSRIWCASDMETFGTWSEELELLQSHDIRAPCLHSGPKTWVTDYLINACPSSPSSDGNLDVFVGSNEGDIALLSNSDLATPQSPGQWSLHKVWSTGHEGIVRSLMWDEQNQVLVTGGEDGKLCVWPGLSQGGLGGRGVVFEDNAMDVDIDATNIDAGKNSKRTRTRATDWDAEDGDTIGKNGKRFKR